MTRPEKVLALLDVARDWDPSLALVMVGAIGVHFLALRFAGAHRAEGSGSRPSLGLDRALVVGSALFGVGWGLGGFCPGPAIAGAGSLSPSTLVFLASMVAGVQLHRAWAGRASHGLAARPHEVSPAVERREERDEPLAHRAA
jgi:uncharacterized membrane protein YedE/YeeE